MLMVCFYSFKKGKCNENWKGAGQMEQQIYQDISERTGGDIYIGVNSIIGLS